MSAPHQPAPATDTCTLGTDALAEEHVTLRQLGEDLRALTETGGGPDDPDWRDAWQRFEAALWRHELVEESFLHPLINGRDVDEGEAARADAVVRTVRWHNQLEHRRRAFFDRVRAWPANENRMQLTAALLRLLEEHERHFAYEEAQVFPLAERGLTADAQRTLARAVQSNRAPPRSV